MAWVHKTVVKEYDINGKEQHNSAEDYTRSETYSPEPGGINALVLSTTASSQMSDP